VRADALHAAQHADDDELADDIRTDMPEFVELVCPCGMDPFTGRPYGPDEWQTAPQPSDLAAHARAAASDIRTRACYHLSNTSSHDPAVQAATDDALALLGTPLPCPHCGEVVSESDAIDGPMGSVVHAACLPLMPEDR
jgi:hypothetical protein